MRLLQLALLLMCARAATLNLLRFQPTDDSDPDTEPDDSDSGAGGGDGAGGSGGGSAEDPWEQTLINAWIEGAPEPPLARLFLNDYLDATSELLTPPLLLQQQQQPQQPQQQQQQQEWLREFAQTHIQHLQQEEQQQHQQLGLPNPRLGFPPPVNQSRVNELKLYASLSAATYCRRQNISPLFQCQAPRCSNPQLTLRSLSHRTPLDHEDGDNDHDKWDQDVLRATNTQLYFQGKKSAMVGFIATNHLLDHFDSPDHPPHILTTTKTKKKKTIIIAFRGSLAPRNFIYDLKFALIDFQYPSAPPGARVHSGFWQIWLDVQHQIIRQLNHIVRQELSNDPDVWFDVVLTGHSLGGATALLAGLMLKHHHDTNSTFHDSHPLHPTMHFRIYTFGEPRVGNVAFANWVMSLDHLIPIQRTTYYNDFVPHLPPRWIPLPGMSARDRSFYHHAAETFIRKGAREVVACDIGWHPDSDEGGDKNGVYGCGRGRRWMSRERGEEKACSRGVGVYELNPLSHLTYWHILFGPWC